MGRSQELVLAIVATDRTFESAWLRGRDGRDREVWWGKCIHCDARLVVERDGRTERRVTVEHIVPRHHGGEDQLENLALACARCNGQKGVRLDPLPRGHPALEAMITRLQERRSRRWRDPA